MLAVGMMDVLFASKKCLVVGMIVVVRGIE